ncbi:MAG: hypothetical protein GY737_10190 [Desulfobacteraceae bacterium]|nr:hypothetical protein [Desulfobacteraceae bacterium]
MKTIKAAADGLPANSLELVVAQHSQFAARHLWTRLKDGGTFIVANVPNYIGQ